MFSILLPKDTNFFDLFDKQAGIAIDAAIHLKTVVAVKDLEESMVQRMKDIEHQGDDIAHDIIGRLDKTFITPFDREDIYALTKEMDDIIDMIHTIVSRLRIYKVDKVDKNLVEFADVIEQSVRSVASAVKGMRHKKRFMEILDACKEVNRLENVGDAMRDRTLGELFEDKHRDPLYIIKWKEIYQDAETVLDICEDVAHVVESIMVKHA